MSGWARVIPAWAGEDPRPEQAALARLWGEDRVIDVVFDTFVESRKVSQQTLRIRCWELLHHLGERQRLGAITKAGNSTCRHVLVQAAWKYRHRPAVGKELRTRQEGQPPHVIAHAWKAQHRLYKVYHRLAHRRCSQIAAVAVARELVGFLWAAMIDLEGCPTMH